MFQTTVVKKYAKSVDHEKLEKAWEAFQAHFHNPQIQENIRNSKEEQYQGEFLIDLFVNVLGYTKNPTPGFNLTTELKNTQDSKKADGAIVFNDVTKAVIELKGTKTTDLTKVQEQAFNYKTSHKGCDVVIISNFEKLRLFIRNQTEYQEFNLFTLKKSQFDLLYLLLAYDYFEKDILIKIKDESLSQEEEITKKLYKDYSDFKRELFQDLVKQNPQYDVLTLFKSSQKLLDRFLFLFFAEDRGLLPPNAVREILRQWKKLQELDAYDTLINRFRKYFGYLNTGFKGKKYDVFAYNGGLFAPDEVLDHVEISDNILYQYTQQLADYDYQSEVDVNILGHIFENSLNEIEEVRADLEGETVDKSKTKRKKDGVFYTPKYITQYIVENTVGKLCEEKKAELDLKDEDYDPGQNYQKKTIAKLEDKLVAYYDWLTALTICDPACGSGAFLNQALDFLIKEHEYLTNLRQNLYVKNGQIAMAFPFSENDILENNLYGVDINEESVEIAKLSLWLRTAKPNRKLNSLSENIKVGNSLIDDPEVAGDKAFVWEKEFAQVFKQKDLEAFHVVLTTHNSRTSQRMRDFKIEKGEGIYWNLEQEILLTQIFSEIIQEKGFRCIAFNICRDHVHLILVCELNELSEIVRVIKGKSAYLYNRQKTSKGFQPLDNNEDNGIKPIRDFADNGLKPVGDFADNGLKPIGDYSADNRLKPVGDIRKQNSKGLQPLDTGDTSTRPKSIDSKESNNLKPDEFSTNNGLKPIGDYSADNGLKPVGDIHKQNSKGLQPLDTGDTSNGIQPNEVGDQPNENENSSKGLQPLASPDNGLKPIGDLSDNRLKPIGDSSDNGLNPIEDLSDNGLKPVGDTSKGLQPLASDNSKALWSQKFFFAELDNWEIYTQDNKHGYSYGDHYIDRAIIYIQNNREKHELPASKELDKIIADFIMSEEEAFTPEYKGGFDVVIGNPPYVSHDKILSKDVLKEKYETYSPFGDLYIFFYELGYNILKQNGICSLITSNSFLKAEYGKPFREFIKKHTTIIEVINIENTQIFSDAIVNTVILSFKNSMIQESAIIVNSEFSGLDFNSFIEENRIEYEQKDFLSTSWNLTNPKSIALQNKIKGNKKTLEDLNTKIRLGIATGNNNAFIISEAQRQEFVFKNIKNQEIIVPILRGRDIDRYYYQLPNKYLLLTKNGIDVENDYPDIYEYLETFGDKFKNRGAQGKNWTNLRACSFFDDFKLNKIVWIELSDIGRFTLCTDEIYLLNSAYFLIPPDELHINFLLSILNSSLMVFYLKQIANTSGMGTTRWINNYVKEFPIPVIDENNQQPFIKKADQMLSLNKELQELTDKFLRTLDRKFEIEKLSKKLEAWHDLTYAAFVKELKKKKVKLSLAEEAEWEDYFTAEKTKADNLKTQINQTDKEIDAMVYELYGLTDEEVEIVEGS